VKEPGQIVLFPFPQTNLAAGKTRPALLLGQLPGFYSDWLICMISSQMHQYIKDFDEIVDTSEPDFVNSGLKASSVIRVGRLAVVEESILICSVGEIDAERLKRIKKNLSDWLNKS